MSVVLRVKLFSGTVFASSNRGIDVVEFALYFQALRVSPFEVLHMLLP